MSDPLLLREDDGAVATLTLNNPAKLNPLSDAMLAALTRHVRRHCRDGGDPGGHPERRWQGLLCGP